MKHKILILLLFLFTSFLSHAQWEHIYTNSNQLFALDVVASDTVFAVGLESAIYTHDGGITWNNINYNCDNLSFRDFEFPTNRVGYIIGINGIVLKSADYGNSWQDISPDNLTEFVESEFISPDTGWIIGNLSTQGDIILRTFNGGNSWHYSTPNVFNFRDIHMKVLILDM